MIRHLSCGIVLLSLLLASCISEPNYPVARLSFDPDLLGTWTTQQGPDAKPLTVAFHITQRDVPTDDERANPHGKEDPAKPRGIARCYQIRIEDPDPETPDLELHGYLLTINGKKMLGVQVSDDHLGKSGVGGWVLPLHRLMPIELRENELRLSGSAALAWVPNARWIDEPAAPTSEPGAILNNEKSDGPLILTNSIDRLLAEYDAARNPPEIDPKNHLVFHRK